LHEFSMMQDVVANILDNLKKSGPPPQGSQIEVVLKVGALELHSAAAARQAYEVLVKDTILEKSRLQLIIEPATISCPKCGYKGTLGEGEVDPHDASPLAPCPECGAIAPALGGRGVESIELIWEDT
jgi:Zn finger protein HypA/HybF involved in hydrogenase expression